MKRIGLISLICICIVLIAPWIGSTSRVDLSDFIFWQLRAPRVLTGVAVGATLGITGAAFQALFGNPLATPSTTGTTAGASLGALTALIILPNEGWMHTAGVPLFAFLGAMAVSIAITMLASQRNMHIEDVLLAGIALTLAAGAMTTGLQFQADIAATYRAVQWSLGSLAQVGYDSTFLLLPLCGIACLGILLQTRALETMISGEEQAFTQGVNVQFVRSFVLFFGGLGVASTVAWCGPIAFIGLVVPHIVRMIFNNTRRILFPMSGVMGATFLVGCDAVARIIFSGQELPVGVLTAIIGAPVLIVLVINRRRSW
ncbi:MAG: iron ABC transporter permease [Myxococcota bacterium]|nr:iron ABC transporter permease [Myxococcota bacterium]